MKSITLSGNWMIFGVGLLSLILFAATLNRSFQSNPENRQLEIPPTDLKPAAQSMLSRPSGAPTFSNSQGRAKASFEDPRFTAPLHELIRGKKNIFVKEEEIVARWLGQEPSLHEMIADAFREVPAEKQIQVRMEALNTLALILSSEKFNRHQQQQAELALLRILRAPIGNHLTENQKRILAAEKYDALTALIHHEPEQGIAALQELKNSALQKILRPAAINALVDLGRPLSEANERVRAAIPREAM